MHDAIHPHADLLHRFLPPHLYGEQRDAIRRHMLAYKQARTVALGPWMRVLFEDAATVRYQVQEVMRAERIVDEAAVRDEVSNYAHLLPDGRSLRATLSIELPDPEQRRRRLPHANQAVHAIALHVDGGPCLRAEANEDLPDRHRGRLSAVHFLRFDLPAAMRAALRRGAGATLACGHSRYPWQCPVPAPLLRRLCGAP